MNHQSTAPLATVPAPTPRPPMAVRPPMLQGERDAAACIRLLLARLQVLDLEGDPKAFEQAQILADELHLHAQFAREARAIEQSIHISPFIPMGMFGDVFEGQLPTLAGLLHRRGQ